MAAPFPSTIHSSGQLTVTRYGAFRSGWSKQAKYRGADSSDDIPYR